jgi:uncharacterized protein YndB with AHSA1/START domain
MQDSKYSEAQMLIRKPADAVFNAMIDPQITTRFWFTKSSGKLEAGKTVKWQWEMYGASADVHVLEIVPNEKIAFEWGAANRKVVFTFKTLSDNATYVTARETGYTETGDELLAVIRDSTGGFTTVLDGMKAFLEHGFDLNLIGDKFPTGK